MNKEKLKKLGMSALSYAIAICASIAIYVYWASKIGLDTKFFGADIYGHVHKIEVYEYCLSHNLDPAWYNGIILFAAWPAGVYAFIHDICNNSIYVFYMVCAALATLPFVHIGNKKGRYGLGIFAGVIFPYIPVMLKIEIIEGNLAWYMAVIITPFVVANIYEIIDSNKDRIRDYLFTIAIGLLFYASLFAVHFILAAITGLFMGLVLTAYLIGVYFRRKIFGYKYYITKVWVCLIYLIINGCFAGVMFITSIRSAMSNMGGEQSGYIWNHTFKESFICSRDCSFYFGIFITLVSLAVIIWCFFNGRKDKSQKNLVVKIFAFAVPLFIIWCAIPVESYESIPLSSMLWPERFSALVISAFLIMTISLHDIIPADAIYEVPWFVTRAIIVLILVDTFLYTNNVSLADYNTAYYDEKIVVNPSLKTIFVAPSTQSYPVYKVKNTNTGWAYQGESNSEYLWTLNAAMKNKQYEMAMLNVVEQCCPQILCSPKYFEGDLDAERHFLTVAKYYGYSEVGRNEEYITLVHDGGEFVSLVDYKNVVVGDWGDNFSIYIDESFNKLNFNDSVYDSLKVIYESKKVYDEIYIFADSTIFNCADLINGLKEKGSEIIIDTSSLHEYEHALKVLDVIVDCNNVKNYQKEYFTTVIANHDADSYYQYNKNGIVYLAQNPMDLFMEVGREINELYPWYGQHIPGADVEVTTVPVKWSGQNTTFTVDKYGECYLGKTYFDDYIDWYVTDMDGKAIDVYDDAGIAVFYAEPGTYNVRFEEKGANLALRQSILFISFYVGIVLMLLSEFISALAEKKNPRIS